MKRTYLRGFMLVIIVTLTCISLVLFFVVVFGGYESEREKDILLLSSLAGYIGAGILLISMPKK